MFELDSQISKRSLAENGILQNRSEFRKIMSKSRPLVGHHNSKGSYDEVVNCQGSSPLVLFTMVSE